MTYILAYAIAIVVALLLGLVIIYVTNRGSGKVVDAERPVKGFTAVALRGQGNLLITQAGTEALRIEAEDNVLPRLVTTVENGELNLTFTHTVFGGPFTTRPINYYLTVKDLKTIRIAGIGAVACEALRTTDLAVDVSGSGTIDMSGLAINSVKATVAGNGNFTLAGAANAQRVVISGTGHYLAKELTTKTSEVRISGSGKVEVQASEKLTIDISGSGNVAYTGTPAVTQKISGSGTVTEMG